MPTHTWSRTNSSERLLSLFEGVVIMKVFLTGATSCIGSAVADKLLAAGHTVLRA